MKQASRCYGRLASADLGSGCLSVKYPTGEFKGFVGLEFKFCPDCQARKKNQESPGPLIECVGQEARGRTFSASRYPACSQVKLFTVIIQFLPAIYFAFLFTLKTPIPSGHTQQIAG
jgi:hypothetical protein